MRVHESGIGSELLPNGSKNAAHEGNKNDTFPLINSIVRIGMFRKYLNVNMKFVNSKKKIKIQLNDRTNSKCFF